MLLFFECVQDNIFCLQASEVHQAQRPHFVAQWRFELETLPGHSHTTSNISYYGSEAITNICYFKDIYILQDMPKDPSAPGDFLH